MVDGVGIALGLQADRGAGENIRMLRAVGGIDLQAGAVGEAIHPDAALGAI